MASVLLHVMIDMWSPRSLISDMNFVQFSNKILYSNSKAVYNLIHEWSQTITIVNTITIIAQYNLIPN